ncbi:hypothetical protein K469DRAFT_607173 [Zopfia rhizophila CBS 207.26]|uniref:Rhodopsin domain-containing protein n=1 Tax=Zopfia rhizophila CBS 207.26 TaxID=1314779 RepID=A0A6A6DAJ9_9PEZI|nr:hypothetical protein K469DRAFT_607173 [Zopfia rhizophila CBS 207.26]
MLSNITSFDEQPAFTPPPDVLSNFTNPPTLMTWIIGVAVSRIVLMIAAMTARLYTRVVLMKEWWQEDCSFPSILLKLSIGGLTYDGLFVYTANLGLARHHWDIRMVDMPRLLELTNILSILYGPTMFAAKFSVLLQLKRIFGAARQRDSAWWALMILIAVVTVYYWVCFFIFVFQCWPRAKIQNPAIKGVCIDPFYTTLTGGVVNLVTDVGILIAPIFAIWHLQVPIKRKLGVASVFGVGLFGCVTGVFSMIWRVRLITSSDITRTLAQCGIWGMAELFAIILVGCMPSLPLFAKTILGRDRMTTGYSLGGSSRYAFSRNRSRIADGVRSNTKIGTELGAVYITIDDESPAVQGSKDVKV